MTTYTFSIKVDDAPTWNDLKKGNYSLYLGAPKDTTSDPIIPVPEDLVGLTAKPLPDNLVDSAFTVDWTPTQSSTAKYSLSYSLDGKTEGLTRPIDLEFGEAVELKADNTFAKMPINPSWAQGALGFKNAIRALPVIFPQDSTNPITQATTSLWVPGEGTLKPTPKDSIYAWFYSASTGGEDADIEITDFSTAKLLAFKNITVPAGAAPNVVPYNDSAVPPVSPWGDFTGAQAARK